MHTICLHLCALIWAILVSALAKEDPFADAELDCWDGGMGFATPEDVKDDVADICFEMMGIYPHGRQKKICRDFEWHRVNFAIKRNDEDQARMTFHSCEARFDEIIDACYYGGRIHSDGWYWK